MNRNITINVPDEEYAEFEKLCSLSGGSKNEYGNALIRYAIRHHLIAGDNTEEAMARVDAIRAGTSPLPKVTLEIKASAPISFGHIPLLEDYLQASGAPEKIYKVLNLEIQEPLLKAAESDPSEEPPAEPPRITKGLKYAAQNLKKKAKGLRSDSQHDLHSGADDLRSASRGEEDGHQVAT